MKELTGSNFNDMKSDIMKSAETGSRTPSRLSSMLKLFAMVYIALGLAMFTVGAVLTVMALGSN